MTAMDRIRDVLRGFRDENDTLRAEVADLRNRLAQAQARLQELGDWSPDATSVGSVVSAGGNEEEAGEAMQMEAAAAAAAQEALDGEAWKWPLAREEYERYSRQLLVPGVGVEGELSGDRLLSSRGS
jgi:adenylyltransferase/sulfurtransferase